MNYHDRGASDIQVARILLSPQGNPDNDDGIIDIAAYHVQQGLEKELKYILHDILGADDNSRTFKTHKLEDLIGQIETYGIVIPDVLIELSSEISDWEASSRYGAYSVASKDEISSIIDLYDHLVNYVKNTFGNSTYHSENFEEISTAQNKDTKANDTGDPEV